MTTLQYKGLDVILQQISTIQLRRRFIALFTAVVAAATIVLGSIAVIVPAAGLWPDQPPAIFRWTLLTVLLGLWVWALVWYIGRSLLWKETIAQTARQIEQVQPELRNDFINSVLLAGDRQQVSAELVQKAIDEAARRSANIDMSQATSLRTLGHWGIAVGSALLMLIVLKLAAPNLMGRGWAVIFSPTQYLERTGSVTITGVAPEDGQRFFVGETVNFLATVDNPTGRELEAYLHIEGEDRKPMLAADDSNTVYMYNQQIRKDLRFAVEVGGGFWPKDKQYNAITVVKKAALEKLELVCDYPTYTGLKPGYIDNGKGDVEALVGTKVTVRMTLNEPIPYAVLDMRGGAPEPMRYTDRTETGGGHYYEGRFEIKEAGSYRIELRDGRNQLQQCFPASGEGKSDYYTIKARQDNPPTVEFISPTSNATVSPGGTLDTRIRVTDDYGIANVRLYVGPARDDDASGEVVPGRDDDFVAVTDLDFSKAKGKTSAVVPYTINLAKLPGNLKASNEGDSLDFYASVTDNKPGGGQTKLTYKLRITVQDTGKINAAKAKQYEELRKKLFEMLEIQERQRLNTGLASVMEKIEDIRDKGREIQAGQTKLRELMVDLVENYDFVPEMTTVQQVIAGLAQTEAVLAIEQSKVLVGLGALRENREACKLLGGTQNRILNTLQGLLAILPSLAKEKDPEEKSGAKANDDMPQDVRDKVSELRDDMEKLIDAQQKIIKESAPLRKKPVDQFTDEDMELLEKLKNQQTDWERFMKSKFDDFSKLALQDMSNPTVMKEMIAIKSDITMAKDALANKSEEIATALEDNGIENAKSLMSNLEKWLPEEPNHAMLSMEAPDDGQENVEAPELPSELEDLVGDLLEEEEDLFEELEDHTSKYGQSGDAIGWDAIDGPISNMNAQGVTGNSLPKDNEISGRSGEGRTGKASGEMVEDKAVGKGGRKTPTRLENDAFQKGQIKDSSEESASGTTGGGKMAGAGQEGLTGPVPPQLKEVMDRVAGKQAQLLNQAERVQAQLDPNDLAYFKLTQAIILMGKVQNDIENHRYANALRARDTIRDNLQQTKLLLTGEYDVAVDASAGMPKYVQQEINDAATRNLPEEYKDALQEYYRTLSRGGDVD